MNFYCKSSIDSIQSCGCSCSSCFYPCRPCCCCKKHVTKPMVKKRSRFGDIFKGQTPNLEDLNYYRKKKKTNGIFGKGGRKKKKGGKSRKRGGKGRKRGKKGNGNGRKDLALNTGGDYDGGKGGTYDGMGGQNFAGAGGLGPGYGETGYGGPGYGGPGSAGTGYGGPGYGGTGYGGTGFDGPGYGGTGYGGPGYGGPGYGGPGYGGAGVGGTGYGGFVGQGGSAGDGGPYGANKPKWKEHNECRPNQLVKCPHTCTLKPKKCIPNQIGPCNEACLKGTPYDELTTPNNPRMGFEKQKNSNLSGGLYCTQGGLQGNYHQTQNVAFNSVDPTWPSTSQSAPHQTAESLCPTNKNFYDVPLRAPQYCSPHAPRPFHSGGLELRNIPQYCGAQIQGSVFPGHQNFRNIPPNTQQFCRPQIQSGYGNTPYNTQPPSAQQYGVNPLEIYCQFGGPQEYMNNSLSQQQNYIGVQQVPTFSPNYGRPLQLSNSPLSNYIQGRDSFPASCPAVHSITCKVCGRERKFIQTLYIKPNVDTIFTTKDVKTKCSQTIA